jgi:hypothetical protein
LADEYPSHVLSHHPVIHFLPVKKDGMEMNISISYFLWFGYFMYYTYIVSDYGLDDRAIGVRSPSGGKGFFL